MFPNIDFPMKTFLTLFVLSLSAAFAQFPTPLERNNYQTLTTHAELLEYVKQIDASSPKISMEIMAVSHGGKQVPALTITDGVKNGQKKKLKVLIFAQQHGNEPSGKEGALLLLKGFAEGTLTDLLKNIDLTLVPQMNPDGADKDLRRNGAGMDLNRNHMIMTEPEVIGLHALYERIDHDVTLDVHEYFPFESVWKAWGYRKNSEVTIGLMTNLNTDDDLRAFQRDAYFPFISSYMEAKKIRFGEYTPLGPPHVQRMRNSTVDINDGRQSFGILGSFSFIQEGLRYERSIDSIRRRAETQCASLTGFLTFMNRNADTIRTMVKRAKATRADRGVTALLMDHTGDGKQTLTFSSYDGIRDTTMIVPNYHNTVIPLLTVTKPKGYLVPKSDTLLRDFIAKHKLTSAQYKAGKKDVVKQYLLEFEKQPEIEEFTIYVSGARERTVKVKASEYLFVPTNQRAAQLIITALEPQGMINLMQYDRFAYLRNAKEYPVLRVE
jgi:hypothetical protein